MARPIKNYCEYFPHDRDMRNHRKVKAIRTKFGISGYAIWVMVLEYLTGIDGNEFEFSDVEIELMAGDFGVSATEIRQLLDYCILLEILFLNNGFIKSESLDERLKPVYEKRGQNKDKSKKQLRVNGKFSIVNTEDHGVSAPEKPQSKVNKSKVNKIKEKEKEKELINHFAGDEIFQLWKKWLDYKSKEFSFKYKTLQSQQVAFDELAQLSEKNTENAAKIINQSIAHGWKGLFLLKSGTNKTVYSQNGHNPYEDQRKAKLAAFKPISEQ